MRRVLCFLLVFIFIMPSSVQANEQNEGHIFVCNYTDNEVMAYSVYLVNNEIFLSIEDIAEITGYQCMVGDLICFQKANSQDDFITIDIEYDGRIKATGQDYVIEIIKEDEKIYLPLEKMLYLTHSQWCVEGGIIYVQSLGYSIMDFLNEYHSLIVGNKVTQMDLLIDGESKLAHSIRTSLAAVFNDFNNLIYVPIWGANRVIDKEYEEALLQLAIDDMQFLDSYGQVQINKYLNKVDFLSAKSSWDNAVAVIELPETTLSTIDSVGKTFEWIKDLKHGTKKFNEYNELVNLTPAQLSAISQHMGTVSDVFTIAEAIGNVSEIANRSKNWNSNFVEQIRVLTNFDEIGYNKSVSKHVKKASNNLIKEYEDTFSATTEAVIEETFKVLGGELVNLTPAGAFTSVISGGLAVTKVISNQSADKIDAADLAYMVNCLIKEETIAQNEVTRSYSKALGNSINGEFENDELARLRNSLMLTLRTNLRNKAFIYYLNISVSDDKNWEKSNKAINIKEDIACDYALIARLMSTESIDKLLLLDSFDNMYSDEFGKKREKINVDDIFNEGNMPLNYSNVDIIDKFINYTHEDYLNDFGNVISEEYVENWGGAIGINYEREERLFYFYSLENEINNNSIPRIMIFPLRKLLAVNNDLTVYELAEILNYGIKIYSDEEEGFNYYATLSITEDSSTIIALIIYLDDIYENLDENKSIYLCRMNKGAIPEEEKVLNNILGEWEQGGESFAEQQKLVFNPDGTAIYSWPRERVEGTYSFNGNSIIVQLTKGEVYDSLDDIGWHEYDYNNYIEVTYDEKYDVIYFRHYYEGEPHNANDTTTMMYRSG